MFYNYYCFSNPHDRLIKKKIVVLKLLMKCYISETMFFFSNSLNFHHIPHSFTAKVFYLVEFYDCTSRLALGNFILCFPVNKKSFTIKVVSFLVQAEVVWL